MGDIESGDQASAHALRRGACPRIAEPMPTGDGLLARLMPTAPVSLDDFLALCDAARTHGNGIVEVTQRGSLQVRGLSKLMAPLFADRIAELGLADDSVPPILTPPLAGFDAEEGDFRHRIDLSHRVDLHALHGSLRSALLERLAGHPDIDAISPKVSVLIDGDGALHLDGVQADVRLRLTGAAKSPSTPRVPASATPASVTPRSSATNLPDTPRLHIAIAGDAHSSTSLGWAEPHRVAEVTLILLRHIAQRGSTGRARDLVHGSAALELRASLKHVLTPQPPPPPRSPAEPIGTHPLNGGKVARGFAPAFGYAHADALKHLAREAARQGAHSIRPAAGRALLVIGLTATQSENLAATAAALGFVVRPDDARRYVVACAGSPACASATLATRQLAPAIAQAAGSFLDGSAIIHVSGCAKGCAHPGAAALTYVGGGHVILRGRAGDRPLGSISSPNLIAGLQRFHSEPQRSDLKSPTGNDLLSRLGKEGILESMGGERWRDITPSERPVPDSLARDSSFSSFDDDAPASLDRPRTRA